MTNRIEKDDQERKTNGKVDDEQERSRRLGENITVKREDDNKKRRVSLKLKSIRVEDDTSKMIWR